MIKIEYIPQDHKDEETWCSSCHSDPAIHFLQINGIKIPLCKHCIVELYAASKVSKESDEFSNEFIKDNQ